MTPAGWKAAAWDGVEFAVPRGWEPARIGRRHLLWESEAGPAFEIRWSLPGQRLTARRGLAALAREARRRGAVLRRTALPDDWRRRLGPEVEAQGFEWEAGAAGAAGALIACTACRRVSLLQFFRPPDGADGARAAARVLASFRDHRADGGCRWALFDIRALLPAEFRLDRHRFEAGRFVLEFHGRGRRLTLFRWAPADLLLAGRSLAEFAAAEAGGGGIDLRPAPDGGPAVEGIATGPQGLLRRLAARLGRARFAGLRVWQVARRNRILGLRLEAPQPPTAGELDRLCYAYGMDTETETAAGDHPGRGPGVRPG